MAVDKIRSLVTQNKQNIEHLLLRVCVCVCVCTCMHVYDYAATYGTVVAVRGRFTPHPAMPQHGDARLGEMGQQKVRLSQRTLQQRSTEGGVGSN